MMLNLRFAVRAAKLSAPVVLHQPLKQKEQRLFAHAVICMQDVYVIACIACQFEVLSGHSNPCILDNGTS